MRLLVTDYSKLPGLAEAIRRYYTLLQLTFSSNVYKVFESPNSQIYRFLIPQVVGVQVPMPQAPGQADTAHIDVNCERCHTVSRLQANLGKPQPIQQGAVPFPANNKFSCPSCGNEIDLSGPRRQIEAMAKKSVV
jgi:hypothetical protein